MVILAAAFLLAGLFLFIVSIKLSSINCSKEKWEVAAVVEVDVSVMMEASIVTFVYAGATSHSIASHSL